jgi:membrane protein involved in colicin uptake
VGTAVLVQPFHSLQTQIELRDYENMGLRDSLETKKKRKKKTYTLELGGLRENTGGAMFFTQSKVKEAQFIERIKQQNKDAETLRKAEEKERKAEASALKKREKEQAKVAREEAKKAKDAKRAMKAAELAAARAKKRDKDKAAATQNALVLSEKAPSTSKSKAKPKPKPKRGALQLRGGDIGGEGPSQPPQKASRTRTIKVPDRYTE